MVLDWDGEEPSVAAVLGAIVWSKEVWLASIEACDQPEFGGLRSAAQLAADHRAVYYTASSLDGFVVDEADSLDWLTSRDADGRSGMRPSRNRLTPL